METALEERVKQVFVEQFGGIQMKGGFFQSSSDVKKELILIGWRTPSHEISGCELWELPVVEVIQLQRIAPNLFDFFAQFFGLKEEYQPFLDWDPDKNYEDYNLSDKIEAKMDQGIYISYAQKRFAKNGGIPDPIQSQDSFTQWMLSIA